jgi:hypothetical protein
MKKELQVVKYIKKHGLEKTVSDFKLKCRIYPNKIHLKYDQLESSYANPEVQECRGLILDANTWEVISCSFFKFFNIQEGYAHPIDWNTAIVYEKLDGSLMQVYYDFHKSEWCVGTTGTAEGEGEVNNKQGLTFARLFWETAYKYDFPITNAMSKKYTYVFELTTPYNIVVKPHGVSSITLLAVRNNETLKELSYDELIREAKSMGVPLVKTLDFKGMSFDEISKTLETMPWSEEGYVVCDANFNRVKIKNPAYVAVHHLKGKMAEHHIMSVIKTNELDEFIATFPDRKEELLRLKGSYDILLSKLYKIKDELIPFVPTSNDDRAQMKTYALAVFDITKKYDVSKFSGLFFNLQNKKVNSIESYMYDFDDKTLYNLL